MPLHKRTITRASIALALAAAAGAASAQSSVTLYGRVDGAVYYQSRANPGAHSVTLSSDTSYFGFRGQEDLGGGLSALFKLESQFDVSTGTSSATGFFNRESYVGLSDRQWGSVLLGSMWGPSVWISGKSDAFGRAQLGAVQTLLQGANNRGNTFQFNNAVQYISPTIGGVFGRVYAQAAEGAATGRNYAMSLDYTKGPAFVGLSYDNAQIAGSTVGLPAVPVTRSRTLGIGASYDLGFMKLLGYVQNNRVPSLGAANSRNISAAIPAGGGEFRIALGHWDRPADADARRVALGYTYFLSKRTQVYANMARLNNGKGSTTMLFPISQDSPALTGGQSVKAVGLGMRHLF
ncbi:porin [Xylophilus sp. ASV27]|uniref:porin n=1 Tax=Xylophilus sp. ASV27 TaxID=2795129 RepID=UPI0018EDD826|nr:porin [Xylophilus sp. ASV27]